MIGSRRQARWMFVLVAAMSAAGMSRVDAQSVSAAAAVQKPLIVITNLYAPHGDAVAEKLAATISNSVTLEMHLVGSVRTRHADFLAPLYSFSRSRRYYREVGAAAAVFGEIKSNPDGTYVVDVVIWRAAGNKRTKITRDISNPPQVFTVADILSLDTASQVVGRHLSEGTLVVRNAAALPKYAVYADGHLLGRNRSTFHLLSGHRKVVVARPGGPLGDVPVKVFEVTIRPHSTTTISLPSTAASAPPTEGATPAALPAAAHGRKPGSAPTTAELAVSVKNSGELFLNGVREGPIYPNKPWRFHNILFGRYVVKVVYSDGYVDTITKRLSADTPDLAVSFRHAVRKVWTRGNLEVTVQSPGRLSLNGVAEGPISPEKPWVFRNILFGRYVVAVTYPDGTVQTRHEQLTASSPELAVSFSH